jgi:hypothetical protein
MPKPSIGKDKPYEIYIKAFLFVKSFALCKRGRSYFLIEESNDAGKKQKRKNSLFPPSFLDKKRLIDYRLIRLWGKY